MHSVQKTLLVNSRHMTFRLEPTVWALLAEVAVIENCNPPDIVAMIENTKPHQQTLASSIREFLMLYFRAATTKEGHRNAGHGTILQMPDRAA